MSKPKFTKNKVTQTINLEEAFGISFKGKRSLREAIGGAIIERIQTRTSAGTSMTFSADGAGRTGRLKSPYSKSYAKSDEFKAFGKSKGKVNMTLTGDMLNLMDITKQTGNSITIGWDDTEENNKAFNHSVGDTVPKRPFFGVSKGELKAIKKDFSKDIKSAVNAKNTAERKAAESKLAETITALRAVTPDVADG